MLTNSFPVYNDLQFARERNEFLSEPNVELSTWPEAMGYESTEDTYRQSELPADTTAEIDQIEAYASDAAQHAFSIERQMTDEREQYVAYAMGISQRIRSVRDLSKSDTGVAA